MLTRLLVLATLLLPVAVETPAQTARDRKLIAVLDLEAVGGTREQSLALSTQLRTEILRTGNFTVVDRGRVDDIMKEQALQQSGCTSQECAVQVGRILGVRQIVSGSVIRIEDRLWQVTAMLIDVETAETLRAESLNHQGPYADLVINGMRRLAELLALAPAAITPRGTLPPAVAAAPAVPLAAAATAHSAQPTAPPLTPEERMAQWKGVWVTALVLGVASVAYGLAESQSADTAKSKRDSLPRNTRCFDGSYCGPNVYWLAQDSKYKDKQFSAEQYYKTGGVLLLSSLVIGLNPPEVGPGTSALQPIVIPKPGGFDLAWQTRW
jgi:TolB-like protein